MAERGDCKRCLHMKRERETEEERKKLGLGIHYTKLASLAFELAASGGGHSRSVTGQDGLRLGGWVFDCSWAGWQQGYQRLTPLAFRG